MIKCIHTTKCSLFYRIFRYKTICKLHSVRRDPIYNYLVDTLKTEYETVRELRRTDRGTVVLVRHKETKNLYIFRRFQGSAEVYRKLLFVTCPYLPRIYEAAEQDGKAAVLEEYIKGDNMQEMLKGALFSESETRAIAMDLCQALRVLHERGAVHRDIKPENVILRGDDAVLIDFDASRVFKAQHTSDTVVLGTTGFAAPEQYGMAQSDKRSDIYSLGVLMNVMLTGQHPSRQLAPGRWGRIIKKCTMTDPCSRYGSATELLEIL